MSETNATFVTFRQSGKYYTEGRGFVPPDLITLTAHDQKRQLILTHNEGQMPGLSGDGRTMNVVVTGDESTDIVPFIIMASEKD